MKIAIAGGTGFVGKALTSYLEKQGHDIYILTRKPRASTNDRIHYIEWLTPESQPEKYISSIDAFINLAGEPINSGRWTERQKQRIINSRLSATRAVLELIRKLDKKPQVLINASAIGIYGTSWNEVFTESSTKTGSDFLARTVIVWEEEAKKAEQLGIRTVLARFGMILGKEEGALPRIVLPYKLFIGGTVGSGDQWLSWVHIKDVVRSIEFILNNENISGAVNITAPHPTKMKEFGQTIAKVLHRPHWLPVPDFALRLLLGEMSILVLEGQRVFPEKLQKFRFNFSFSSLEEALYDILQS
ncbi:TIGR01777 family oxidoreductase [Bacillus alveayuensis]|uniref:TIGR01777 family oxidoreductase n=1 Tax=Aeribacillus alveayuensis TaxID=279215 RepID=UPI0005D1206B|nr:TIGR01777 family oxidoreductase [Bacillus alveayuensis]